MISKRVRCSPSSILKQISLVRSIECPSIRPYSLTTKTDDYGMPTTPTWSVTKLLSSYPKPSISPQTLNRIHELAALIPPTEDTPEYIKLREEVSELVRLVEAVRLVDTKGVSISARWDKEDADRRNMELPQRDIPEGHELLKHAARTESGFYLVDTDRRKKLS